VKREVVEYGLAAAMIFILMAFYFIFVSPYLSDLIDLTEGFRAEVATMGAEGIPKEKISAYLNSELRTFKALSTVWVCIQFLIVGAGMLWLTGIRRVARSYRQAKEA